MNLQFLSLSVNHPVAALTEVEWQSRPPGRRPSRLQMWPTWSFLTWVWRMFWSCSYSSSPWLSSLLPPWNMPYLCLKQVGGKILYITVSVFCLSRDQILHISPHLFHYIDCVLSLFDLVEEKKNLSCSYSVSLFLSSFSLSQRVRMCSIVFWSCCATPSPCSGTAFASWSGTSAAWWGWSWQVKTQLMTASYVDEWIHFTERGNWVGHQTICHRHTHTRHTVLSCQGEL